MSHAQFTWRMGANYVYIVDLCHPGTKSVTNDVEYVLEHIKTQMNNPRFNFDEYNVIYCDSDGNLDGILTLHNKFHSFIQGRSLFKDTLEVVHQARLSLLLAHPPRA